MSDLRILNEMFKYKNTKSIIYLTNFNNSSDNNKNLKISNKK